MSDTRSSSNASNVPRASAIPRLLKPLWRRVLVAGWLLFAVSFLLPALAGIPDRASPPGAFQFAPPTPPPVASAVPEAGAFPGPGSSFLAQGTNVTPGWEAFLFALLGWGGILGIASALTNLLMAATAFHGKWPARVRWPANTLAAAGALNLGYWLWWVADDGASTLEIGYYVWVVSFVCAVVAFRLRAREERASLAE